MHAFIGCARLGAVLVRVAGFLRHLQGPLSITSEFGFGVRRSTARAFFVGSLQGGRQQSALLLGAAVVRGRACASGRGLPSHLSPLLPCNVLGTIAAVTQTLDEVG